MEPTGDPQPVYQDGIDDAMARWRKESKTFQRRLIAAVVIPAFAIVIITALIWINNYSQNRETIRNDFKSLGLIRWSDAPVKAQIDREFTGSTTQWYRLQIPTNDVANFISSFSSSKNVVQKPSSLHIGSNTMPPWWRPQDLKDVEVFDYEAIAPDGRHSLICRMWVSPSTGIIYLYKED